MNGSPNAPRDYLKRPYARVLTPDEEYGGYTAEILEFPGCVTEGDTAAEALENLEAAAEAWVEAALSMGQEIPEPSDYRDYAGRVALRLPRSLHGRAVRIAEREGTSLNQFIVAAVAEQVGAWTLYARMTQTLTEQVAEVASRSVQSTMGSAMGEMGSMWRYLHWITSSSAVTPMRLGDLSVDEPRTGLIWRALEPHGPGE